MAAQKDAQEVLVEVQHEDQQHTARVAPSQRSFASRALRTMFMEFVGTFVANLLSLGVITASFMMNSQAQAHTLLDTVSGGDPMPPGAAIVPVVIPDSTGAIPIAPVPGHAAAALNHLYISFPQQQLFIAIGIGFSFAVGLMVAPGCTLNPTFAVALAVFEKHERATALFAVLGQMLGAVAACWLMYAMGWELLRASTPGIDGYNLGDFQKSEATAGLYGVIFPPDNLTFASTFLNTVVFVVLMVFATVPTLAGKGLHRAAKPLLVAAIIVPVVMAQSPFGVQNNPAMYIGGLIFTSMAGWPSLWAAADNYVVCVATAPAVGAILGGVFLKLWAWLIYNPASPLAIDEHEHGH